MPSCNGRRARPVPAICWLGAFCLLSACASYQARPIDPESVLADWHRIDARAANDAVDAALSEHDAWSSAAGFDLDDGVSLQEAEAVALFYNPSLRITRIEAGVAEASAQEAGLWRDPGLDVGGEYILEDVDERLLWDGGIALSIPISGRLGVERKLAAAELAHAQVAVLGAEWALLGQLRQEWARLAALHARETLLQDSQKQLQSLLAASARYKAAQALTVVEERLLLLQERRVQDQLLRVRAEQDEQQLRVIALLGLHPGHDWRLNAELPKIADADVPDDDFHAVLGHVQLRLALAAYAVAERQVQLQIRKQYPDLRIGLGGGSEEGLPRLALAFGLLPIPLWNRNARGIAEARGTRRALGVELERALQGLVHRLATHRRRLTAMRDRLRFLQTEVAPLADAQLQDARRLTALGRLDLFLLADAMEQARASRLELLDARLAVVAAQLAVQAVLDPFPPALRRDGDASAQDTAVDPDGEAAPAPASDDEEQP